MCGIAGFYSTTNFFSQDDIEKMTISLAHRGPDAMGHFSDEYCSLGHRRLSILDLSSGANQPLISSNNRFVISYNGEIYNFTDLKKELQDKDKVIFKTSSDTEVILEGLALYGEKFIHKLNGMFSIAFYDKREKKLMLFRDRIGIKPLYYFWDGKNFAFASELKALKKLKSIQFEIEHSALLYFFQLGYTPSPLSIYTNIYKLEPGHQVILTATTFNKTPFWSLEEHLNKKSNLTENEQINELRTLLHSSVKQQLQSDVPVGIFLSGGIDSGIVAAIAAKESSSPIKTFTIGFKEEKYNEAKFAEKIAEHIGANHTNLIIDEEIAVQMVESMLDSHDEPFADSSAIPTMLVSKLAKKHVTVALAGDGGDELFLGYGTYQWAKRLNHPFVKLFSKLVSKILALSKKYRRHAAYFKLTNKNNPSKNIFTVEQNFFTESELKKMLKKVNSSTKLMPFELFYKKIGKENNELIAEEKQAAFDIKYYLPDDLLTKVDRASMSVSLEVRVPLLDNQIVDFALNLDAGMKYKNNTRKYILKKILFTYVPQELYNRPKQGFSIPLEKWLKTDLSYLIDLYLSRDVIIKHQLIDPDYVSQLVNDFRIKKTSYLHSKIWNLVVLHRWLEKNTN